MPVAMLTLSLLCLSALLGMPFESTRRKRGVTTSRSDRPPPTCRRFRHGLRGRFGAFHEHFGEDTGRRIASDRRSPVSEGYG